MQVISFRKFCIFIALLLTSLLFIAIISLFLVPNPKDVLSSIRTKEMIYSLKLSIITSLISTFTVMLLSIPAGYALSRYSFKGKNMVKSILDLPIAFPELVLGLALLLLFGQTYIGKFLESIGIHVVFTKLGIIVAQVFTALPYGIRIIYSTFEEISPRYEFVSRALGYNELETFINVTLPLAKNGLFASTIITFARCMGAFGAVLILAGGSYCYTETLPITLYLNISYGNIGMAITSGIVLVIISFIAIFAFEKLESSMRKGENKI
ncbi:NifC-like ABC-type porter [Methanocaldococcus villosus KIN24-T80]|uniref:NifC-like ABC-type porter n=1 Tax=Methanocaldococcus villosus KIN24-T80 TaxID=1069083 RepID=N6V384_9EURY|nr:ABC transporter permease [Methanocaldococcus villosus]ENN96718.1 NifC-like ABC-type porter [Methanocaldococcus villosus KIN24-T80]